LQLSLVAQTTPLPTGHWAVDAEVGRFVSLLPDQDVTNPEQGAVEPCENRSGIRGLLPFYLLEEIVLGLFFLLFGLVTLFLHICNLVFCSLNFFWGLELAIFLVLVFLKWD